jgi:dynein heavy chain 1
MKPVEDVLGKGWELYAEGQKLQFESAAFCKKLDTRPVYDAWLHDINRRDMGVNCRLFEIVHLRGGISINCEL